MKSKIPLPFILSIVAITILNDCNDGYTVKYTNEVDSTNIPRIYSFTPKHGLPYSNVKIYGKNLFSLTDSISVYIGKIRASVIGNYERNDTSYLTIKVPDNAVTANIFVKRNNKTDSTKEYFFVDYHGSDNGIIFAPKAGPIGSTIEILNNGFIKTNLTKYYNKFSIFFANSEAKTFKITDRSIETQIPVGATTAPIKMVFGNGTFLSKDTFTVAKPTLKDFIPKQGRSGDTILLTGDYLNVDKSMISVKFGNVPASIIDLTKTYIKVIVPQKAVTAKISVTILSDKLESATNFKIIYHEITSFNPKTAYYGDKVVISGNNFVNDKKRTEVFFGKVKAEIESITSNSIITKVPENLTEIKVPIVVSIDSGMVASKDSFKLIKSKWNFKTGTIEISGIICEFSNVSVFRYPPDYNETKNWIDSSAISWKNDLMSCPTNNNNKDTNYFCNDTKPIVYFKTAVILYPASNKSGILNINQSIHEFSKTPNDPYIDCIRTVSCESINYLINNDGSIEGYIMGQNLINCNLKFYYQYVSDYVSGNIKDYKQNTFVKILRFTDNSYIKIILYP